MFRAFERSNGDFSRPLVKRVVAAMARYVRNEQRRDGFKAQAKQAAQQPQQGAAA